MNANDLRIGNYTEYNIIDENSDEWVFNEVEVEDFFDLDNLRPIPLTEQWLIDFGFEKHSQHRYFALQIEPNKDFIIDFSKYSNDWFLCDTNIDTNIKHVHQLQNLFYSLTGKELKR